MGTLTSDPGTTAPAVTWIKSSFSFANGNCVEVADLPGGHVGVRDSKDPQGGVLRFTPAEWQAFIGGVHNGEFDKFGGLCSLDANLGHISVRLAWGEGPSGPSPLLFGVTVLARRTRAMLYRLTSEVVLVVDYGFVAHTLP